MSCIFYHGVVIHILYMESFDIKYEAVYWWGFPESYPAYPQVEDRGYPLDGMGGDNTDFMTADQSPLWVTCLETGTLPVCQRHLL